ncbi:MAG: hypothetical protein KKD39_05235 [Candidatus Altiarchaeota archaeon]|nr:hypothetical protein [Candidatus Altiarchaeota archaeon]
MEKKYAVFLVPLLFLFFSFLLADDASAEIIIINQSKPVFYSMEQMVLSGDFDTNKLSLTGFGEVISGDTAKVYVLGSPEDILVSNVLVNGGVVPVSFDDRGYYMVLDKGKFKFSADVSFRSRGQARIYVPGPVNEVKFDLLNGYAINGDQYGAYKREIILQRSEKVAMLSEGAFKYSFAEKNTFTYNIRYRSFGKSLGQTVIDLKNGENILSVSGVKHYSAEDGRLVLELTGEEANVYVTGTFSKNSIRMPLPEGRHHVLIESDPERKISIETDAEEIDLSQSSISPSYSNARGFLASSSNFFKIDLTVLQKYPSLAASVSRAVNKIAITEKGSMLAELTYNYANTGVDYISLDAPGTPLYAGTGYRNAVKLTKDAGKLYLSFPKTQSGTLDVIYFDTRKPLSLVDYVEVPVANTDLIITQAQTQVILPENYYVLWTFGANGGSELPSIESVIIFLLVFGGIGYMLKEKTGFTMMYVVYSLGLYIFSPLLLAFSLLVSAALIVKKHISNKSMKWMLAGAAAIVVLCLFVVVFFGFIMQLGTFNMGSSTASVNYASDYAMVEEAAPPMAMQKSRAVLGSGEGALNVPVREGVLPVKIELPALGKSVTVTSHMVNKEDPLKISVLIVRNWVKYPLYLISIIAGLLCLKELKKR